MTEAPSIEFTEALRDTFEDETGHLATKEDMERLWERVERAILALETRMTRLLLTFTIGIHRDQSCCDRDGGGDYFGLQLRAGRLGGGLARLRAVMPRRFFRRPKLDLGAKPNVVRSDEGGVAR